MSNPERDGEDKRSERQQEWHRMRVWLMDIEASRILHRMMSEKALQRALAGRTKPTPS